MSVDPDYESEPDQHHSYQRVDWDQESLPGQDEKDDEFDIAELSQQSIARRQQQLVDIDAESDGGDEDSKVVDAGPAQPAVDDDLAELTNPTPVGPRGFRFNARSVFATWSQCGLDATTIIARAKSVFGVRLKSWALGFEQHADGSPHVHGLFVLSGKFHCRNPLFLDLQNADGSATYHPNIRPVKPGTKSLERVFHYVCKGGNIRVHNNPLFQTSTNFVRRQVDFQKWVEFTSRHEQLRDIEWPISLPIPSRNDPSVSATLAKPKPSQKKRHLWLWGPPNWGKTFWLSTEFRLRRVFMRPSGSPTPFDAYDGEEVIIYDDVKMADVDISELQSCCNVWYTQTEVPGRVRYHTKFWPLKQIRTIIVLSNKDPMDIYAVDQAAFEARFNVINLNDYPPYGERDSEEDSTNLHL